MEVVKSLTHPTEILALLRLKFLGCDLVKSKCDFKNMTPSLKQCYDLLIKVSPSYAAMTMALGDQHRDALCIFYLVLRALDTVEDDMTIPKEVKVPLLKSLYTKLLEPEWKFTESNDKDKIVLEYFPVISKEFRKLPATYKDIISDTCQNIGDGMALFIGKEIDTMDEYDEYCHYASSVLGMALVRFFLSCDGKYAIGEEQLRLINMYGLLLQKGHVIADFFADWHESRVFWPKVVWSKYVSDIGDFLKPENQAKALACLNELITNALEFIPASISFTCEFKNPEVFSIVSIIMTKSVATLERCYNNPQVFSGAVGIRKGEIAKLMIDATSVEKFKGTVRNRVLKIMTRIPDSDPSASKTREMCQRALEATEIKQEYSRPINYSLLYIGMGLAVTAATYVFWF